MKEFLEKMKGIFSKIGAQFKKPITIVICASALVIVVAIALVISFVISDKNQESKTKVTPTVTAKAVTTPTDTPVPAITNTPVPTDTPVPTPTFTPVPTPTPAPTNTPVPTPTFTPVPTPTYTPVPTVSPTPTYTPVPTATPTAVFTATPVPTSTPLPTVTPTPQDEGALRETPNVTLELDSEDCTYLRLTDDNGKSIWYITGLSKRGLDKFRKYTAKDYVEIIFPKKVKTKNEKGYDVSGGVGGYWNRNSSESSNLGDGYEVYTLNYILTPTSGSGGAYAKFVFPETLKVFAGASEIINYYSGKVINAPGNAMYKLREIDFGRRPQLQVIKSQAFKGFTGLTSIKIPSTVTSIENNAFEGCTNLKFETLDVSGIQIGARAFEGVQIEKLVAYSNPEKGRNVRDVDSGSFWGANIKEVQFENEVSVIPDYYFAGAYFSPEKEVDLNEVTVIGKYSFAGCYDLTVTITSAVWELEETSFVDCVRLKAYVKYGCAAYGVLKKAGIEFTEVR